MVIFSSTSSIISDFGLIAVQLSALFGLLAYYFIHYKKRPLLHAICMGTGVVLLYSFLVLYITNYLVNGVKTFGGPFEVALFYYPFLVIHIITAIIMGFITTYQVVSAVKKVDLQADTEWKKFNFEKTFRQRHRKLGKYGVILWLFTAISGLMVYIMLYVLYSPIKII